MYCPKCGKKNPNGSRFCMHCGADLSGYKVEVAPKIEVSPKISVSAKAEGGMTLKWKQEPIKYAKIEGVGKLPVYEEDDLAKLEDKHFCPLCGNYASLKKLEEIEGVYKVIEKGEEKEVYAIYNRYQCLACDKILLGCIDEEIVLTEFERNFNVRNSTGSYKVASYKKEKIPAYKNLIFCNRYENKSISLSSKASLIMWEEKGGTKWYVYTNHSYSHVAFCPTCKRNWGNVKPVRTCSEDYQGTDDTYITIRYYSNAVERWGLEHPLYSLWECDFCGKFLVSHAQNTSHTGLVPYTFTYIYSLCEFCNMAYGEYACSVCGKRICKNCAVKEVVLKRRFFFDKTIKLCPDCAKER